MQSNPLVSIIIPTYNRAHLIEETLDSVLAQTYTNWECIIVDDGSTDNTDEVIRKCQEKDNRFKYYHRPKQRLKGPNSCRNYGFEVSKGDYIHFMDSDDLYFKYSLEKYLSNLDERTDVVVAQVETMDFETGESYGINNLHFENLISDFFMEKIIFYVSGPLWKRSFLKNQSELFDEHITRQDDWEFNIRMLIADPLIKFIYTPLVKYRKHQNSLNNEVSKLNTKEIKSHIVARKKIEEIIRNKKINTSIDFKGYLISFYTSVYKNALLKKHPDRYKYFKILLTSLLKDNKVIKSFYLLFSYISFELFGRGFLFLKKI